METYFSRSFLKIYTYMKGISMESLYNVEDNATTRHLVSTSKTSNTRNGLHLIESLATGVPQNPKISQAIAKATGCSLQPDG